MFRSSIRLFTYLLEERHIKQKCISFGSGLRFATTFRGLTLGLLVPHNRAWFSTPAFSLECGRVCSKHVSHMFSSLQGERVCFNINVNIQIHFQISAPISN